MAELKTKKSIASVEKFINSVPDAQKQKDAFIILGMMKVATGEEPKMWGSSIIGFGDLHYKYESGREGDWFKMGFSPRKQNLTLYLTMGGGLDKFEDILKKLGKYKTGKGCLYINKLADVESKVLKQIIERAAELCKKRYN
jgi:hypothetical protein